MPGAEAISMVAEADRTRRRLFFIVGSGRCGTTLLRAMLCAHPKITIPVETHYFTTFRRVNRWRYRKMGPSAYSALMNDLGRWQHARNETVDWEQVRSIMLELPPDWASPFLAFLTAVRLGTGSEIVGEKTPGHIRHMEELSSTFPDAKFVHLIRDPRDVVASYLEHTLYARVYRRNVVRAALKWREAARLHFDVGAGLSSDRYRLLHYEELVLDTERTVRSLAEFLGIEFSEAMLDPRRAKEVRVSEPANHRMIEDPVTTSRVASWTTRLSPEEVAITERICGGYLDLLGYARSAVGKRGIGPVRLAGACAGASASFARFAFKRVLSGR